MCNNGITVNKGFFASVTACQHIKFRNLNYVAKFDMTTNYKCEMEKFQYFTASLHSK